MPVSTTLSPPHSIFFIADQIGREPPEPIQGETIHANRFCIAISCYPEQDGETTVSIGPSKNIDMPTPPIFDGHMQTPGGVLTISTSERETIATCAGARPQTRVRIWLNRPRWPNHITIGVGE